MWVRSQDKRVIFEFKEAYINMFDKEYCVEINGYDMGYYSTEEKAMEVLDMIEKHLTKGEITSIFSGYSIIETKFFQMPLDSEVE